MYQEQQRPKDLWRTPARTSAQDELCPFKINLFSIDKKVSQNVNDISSHTILTQFKNKTIMPYLIKIL